MRFIASFLCYTGQPKINKRPYKSLSFANSRSCTITELSILLTFCLTAIKNMLLSIVKQFMRGMVKVYFGILKLR